MYCLKCGKETGSERVFCGKCLESMEKYPIKPGAHISLPNRPAPVAVKKNVRRKVMSAEEQVRSQKKTIRLLSICLVLMSILLVLCAYALFKPGATEITTPIGQNYTIDPTG